MKINKKHSTLKKIHLLSGVASMWTECVISHILIESSNLKTLQYFIDFFG
jgi:hypothetical protein